MDSKIDKIKELLIAQYSKLDGLTIDATETKLSNIDWQLEFKKLNKNSQRTKYCYFALIAANTIFLIYSLISTHNKSSFSGFGNFIFIFSGLFYLSAACYSNFTKTNEKIRIFGLLFEIYKNNGA